MKREKEVARSGWRGGGLAGRMWNPTIFRGMKPENKKPKKRSRCWAKGASGNTIGTEHDPAV